MLYSNTELKAKGKEMEWGTLRYMAVGEEGRGRRLISLPCPPDIEIVEPGLQADLTITKTKSGRPRISHGNDNELYMVLSAQGGYTRRGNGTIQVPAGQENLFEIIARGNGADGDAGRIGYWDCMVIKAPVTDAVIRVRTSGAGYGTPSDIYIIHESAVYHCTLSEIEECCESIGIDIPTGIVYEDDGLVCQKGAWSVL